MAAVIRRVACIGLICAAAAVTPGVAGAQTSARPSSSRPGEPRWEVSFHGTLATRGKAPTGESRTPAAGPTFVMADGSTPSRYVSSWFFGDGTDLLNQVLGLRGIGSVRALDQPPGWPIPSPSGAAAGVRLSRHIKGGIWFETGVDFGLTGLGFDDAENERIEAIRASFETAFGALARSASSVIAASSVTSAVESGVGGRRLLVSGVVQYRGPERVVRPVVLGGVGVVSTVGSPATLTLTGTYRFTTPSQAVIEETDTTRLRYTTSSALVWIFGGGFMHDLSRSSAYRVELRVLATAATKTSAELEASPSRVMTTPGGVVVLNATSPGLQFSSISAIAPSLSHARTAFDAFSGEGSSFQLALSASYVWKF